ncbi:nuclease-related domain-containing protein [Cytobacillus purgationiresistens]|uniref:NERD domain-containing protein n=1 Tax=Cytobacillus purgationiresistens TaxID=863449 RepID=A0ABU0ANI8_9BACI|nr:nuclease-related domain-containing protein [Cytobacillus purgationiresistens]MDQ0272822.1 hypothetical protein [Cytobacillus purgationiresistens]
MIHKPRKMPLLLLQLQALSRRILYDHPKLPIITSDLNKAKAGYKGEKSIDYILSFLDSNKYHIFHDIRLQTADKFFQIDTLILTRKFLLAIEVKNIAGTLYFDPIFHQLIRRKDGEEIAFPDPLIQISRHENLLRQWLKEKHLPQIPIFPFVVISNPQTIIRTTAENRSLNQKVLHRDYLLTRIEQIQSNHRPVREKDLNVCIQTILSETTESNSPILNRYNLSSNELIKGVICPYCQRPPMTRKHSTWICPHCHQTEKSAHITALNDYFLLINQTAKNKHICDYFQTYRPSLVKRFFHTLNYNYSGRNKGRVYQMKYIEEREDNKIFNNT